MQIEKHVIDIGCVCTGCMLILYGLHGQPVTIDSTAINFPTEIGTWGFIALGSMCLGVQNIVLEQQKRIFEKVTGKMRVKV